MEQDTTPRSAARQAGLLFAAAGILTIRNNFVPGSGYLDKAFLHVVGVACIAIGAGVALLPWDRWPARATLTISPLAFAIIAVANQRGGVSTYSYAPFFILVFMWVGLHHPPRTSFLLAPLAALASWCPGWCRPIPPTVPSRPSPWPSRCASWWRRRSPARWAGCGGPSGTSSAATRSSTAPRRWPTWAAGSGT